MVFESGWSLVFGCLPGAIDVGVRGVGGWVICVSLSYVDIKIAYMH